MSRPQHFWQYVALHFGFGPPGTRITVSQFLWDLLATQVWLAIPVGLLAASLSVWNAERAAGGAEWSPFVRRRQRIDQRTRDRKTARPVARPRDHKLTTPALGIALDGDLPAGGKAATSSHPPTCGARPWPWSAPPAPASRHLAPPRLPGGRAGSQGLLRRLQRHRPHPGSGPDRRLPARQPLGPSRLLARHRHGHVARLTVQVASRLLAVEPFTEPFYQRVASAGLRLALTAPDMPPVEGSDELLRRLDPDELAALWEGRPLQLKDIEAIGHHLPGARLRYADFFAALAGAFDRGAWSFEDVDLAVLTVPTLLSKAEADAAMRVVLEDYGHYATGRKPRQGEDALLVLDEFSALASGVDSAINLAERVRDVGVQVVVAAQSVEGLGRSPPGAPAAGLLCRRDRGPSVPRP